ncbi:MAG: SDR family NAD(P)-dependent oxidoreductase, partial [Phyllobacterium sp.]
EVETVLCDLGDRGAAQAIVDAAGRRFGRLDGLAANAGFPSFKSLQEGTIDDIEAAFRVNLFSFFELARASLPMLKHSSAARIVATGSFTAHVFRTDLRQFPISASSKGALETAVRSLAATLSADGITVNCVVPGFIEKDSNTSGISTAERETANSRIPLARFGRPDEVAAAIEFLLSVDAGYITGQSLHVNGGLI